MASRKRRARRQALDEAELRYAPERYQLASILADLEGQKNSEVRSAKQGGRMLARSTSVRATVVTGMLISRVRWSAGRCRLRWMMMPSMPFPVRGVVTSMRALEDRRRPQSDAAVR